MLLSKLKVVFAVVTLAALTCAIGGMSVGQGQVVTGQPDTDKAGPRAQGKGGKLGDTVEPLPKADEPAVGGKAIAIIFPATVVKAEADALSITVKERARNHIVDTGGKTPNVKVTPGGQSNHLVSSVYETVLQHLGVSPKAEITSGGKEIKLSDLKPDTDVELQLAVDSDGRLLVIGIEAVAKGGAGGGTKDGEDKNPDAGPGATPPPSGDVDMKREGDLKGKIKTPPPPGGTANDVDKNPGAGSPASLPQIGGVDKK
jgi:hypothetical protein